jgi:VanZ family protein
MCVAIFLFSQDRNSGQHSHAVLVWLLGLIHVRNPEIIARLDYPFRKLAHLCVYASLSALTYRALALGQGRKFIPTAAWRTLAFCAAYATSDEIHQIFIPSRGPAFHDVVIDTAAAALALLGIWLTFRGSSRDGGSRPTRIAPGESEVRLTPEQANIAAN